MYLNKLKSEINDLKREKVILEETIKKQTSEKMRLKTELIKSNNNLDKGVGSNNSNNNNNNVKHMNNNIEQ